jgi:Fe-S cluster assembly protein SufD
MNDAVLAPVTAHYRDAFELARPHLRGSPERRHAAIARFAELGFPGPREEAWKYTNLRRLEARRFAPAVAPATTPDLGAAFSAHRLVLVDGQLQPHLSTPDAAASCGFTMRTLADAGQHREAADEFLWVPAGGGTERFAALNSAFSVDPLLLECGTCSDEVLHVSLVAASVEPSLSSPRLAVRMAPGSRARLLLDYVDDGQVERFVNSVLDVELGAGAQLQVYRLQRLGARTFHIDRTDARVGTDARLVCRDSQLGGALARLDLNVALDGRAAQAELTGVFLADGSRHLDTHLLIDHHAAETVSLQDYRGVAANRGRAVFNGKAVVHAGALKSNARQSSRNLLLTPGAEIDTKPELEIYADDVQCSHGATTGQLDPNALFYLRSRGLNESEARSALTRAFAAAVLSRVDVVSLAAHVHDELDRRLVGLLEVSA